MMWAAIGGHLGTVILLVDNNASINLKNKVYFA
jgi:hypothetical protein